MGEGREGGSQEEGTAQGTDDLRERDIKLGGGGGFKLNEHGNAGSLPVLQGDEADVLASTAG